MRDGKPDNVAERRVLERFVGRWDLTGKVYDLDRNAPLVQIEGWCKSSFMGDSPFLIVRSKGRAGTAPFERVVILCYDSQKGKYTAAGAHSAFPTRLILDEGTYDEAAETISWREKEILASESGRKILAKGEETFKDEDTILQTAYINWPGSEKYVVWVETTLKRRMTRAQVAAPLSPLP
jgi:hypothetical protein